MNKIVKIILIVVSAAMTFTGVLLYFVVSKNNTLMKDTTITLRENTTKTLKAEIKDIVPDTKNEYVINLTGESKSDLIVTLAFRIKNDGELKNFIHVEITTNDKTIQKSLDELLKGDKIELGANVNKIKIVYAMPATVGNEAQGKSISFYIDIKGTRKAG